MKKQSSLILQRSRKSAADKNRREQELHEDKYNDPRREEVGWNSAQIRAINIDED